jgi:hypothetical protein
MFTNQRHSRQDRACCFPSLGNQAAKASRARPQRRFVVSGDWAPQQDLLEVGYEPTDQDLEAFIKQDECDHLICAAELRLLESAKSSTAAAKDFSKELLGVLIAEINDGIQVDRTYKTTPPAAIGLPRTIVHVALAARLLPVPSANAALEYGRREFFG